LVLTSAVQVLWEVNGLMAFQSSTPARICTDVLVLGAALKIYRLKDTRGQAVRGPVGGKMLTFTAMEEAGKNFVL
jgi:hypothetical protein